MLDVLHYFMEEDFRYKSAEEYEGVNSVRTHIYEVLYGTTYKFKGESIRSSQSGGRKYINTTAGGADIPMDLPSDTQERKPYIPPTDMNPESSLPFGDVLDSPLG